jgi:hypothetical protein
LSHR